MHGIAICLAVLLSVVELFGQVPLPTLPNTDAVITCYPDTTGYRRITVGPVDRDHTDLQAAINAARPGTVIVLDAGATFSGSFALPEPSIGAGWIIITSSRAAELPPPNDHVQPSDTSFMARIVTTNPSGLPAFHTQARAHHYRLVGLEITAAPTVVQSYGLAFFGDGSAAQSTLDVVPHHLIVDRCYIHGHDEATIMKFGVRLDCANAAIIDSYISDFHSIGYDAQAIAGINGPGPFKIIGNVLSASGENIMFGGAAPAIAGLVPSDIEIRANHLFKPFTWRQGHKTYAGKHWTIKNLFELKTGRRVLFDGNTLEQCWADLPIGQSGYAILLTVRNEGGASPQADVSDVTISNNIIRDVGAGITLSGTDDTPSNRSTRIHIVNNRFDNVDGSTYGDGNDAGPNVGTFIKIGDPTNVTIAHNTISQTGVITWAYKPMSGFVFVNNRVNCFKTAGGYQGMYGPGKAAGNASMAYYFPDVTDANQHFHNNALIGGTASAYSNYTTISTNTFPASMTAAPAYTGVVQSTLDSAVSYRISCASSTDVPSVDRDLPQVAVFPNPAHTVITITVDADPATIEITDLLGLRADINVERTGPRTFTVNCTALARGPYFIRIGTQRAVRLLPLLLGA